MKEITRFFISVLGLETYSGHNVGGRRSVYHTIDDPLLNKISKPFRRISVILVRF